MRDQAAQLDEARRVAAEALGEREALRRQVERERKLAAGAEERKRRVIAQIDAAGTESAELRGQLRAVELETEQLRAQLQGFNAELAAARERLGRADGETAAATGLLEQERVRNTKLEQRLEALALERLAAEQHAARAEATASRLEQEVARRDQPVAPEPVADDALLAELRGERAAVVAARQRLEDARLEHAKLLRELVATQQTLLRRTDELAHIKSGRSYRALQRAWHLSRSRRVLAAATIAGLAAVAGGVLLLTVGGAATAIGVVLLVLCAVGAGVLARVALGLRHRPRAGPLPPLPSQARPQELDAATLAVSLPAPRPIERGIPEDERETWVRRLFSDPVDPRNLVVAAVMDEMSAACFDPECRLVQVTAEDWRAQLAAERPDLLLVESAWNGNSGGWQYRIASYPHPDYAGLPQLRELVTWASDRGIPTVFWNKEDPVHFDRFKAAAALFDVVLTTDANCIERYRALPGARAQVVEALPFAAQPRLHNPITPDEPRLDAPCFAGTFYRDRHVDRQAQLEWLLDAGKPHGLVIYDRMHGSTSDAYGFPERFRENIAGQLPYDELVKVYKRHKVFLNVNSVTDSPTMCSRRVFELIACDTSVVSTDALSLRELLPGAVAIAADRTEAEAALAELLGDETARAAKARTARRLVLRMHTYRERMRRIAELAGFPVAPEGATGVAVAALADESEDTTRLAALIDSQELTPAEVLVGYSGAADPGPLEQLPDVRVRLVEQAADRPDGERLAELGRLSASPWVFVCAPDLRVGSQFMLDQFLATRYADAHVIGASTDGSTQRYCNELDPRGFLISRAVLAERGAPADADGFGALFRGGVRLYAAENP